MAGEVRYHLPLHLLDLLSLHICLTFWAPAAVVPEKPSSLLPANPAPGSLSPGMCQKPLDQM